MEVLTARESQASKDFSEALHCANVSGAHEKNVDIC